LLDLEIEVYCSIANGSGRGGNAMKTGPSHRYKLAGKDAHRKTSRDVFDGTLQKTQIWLNDLMSELDWEGKPEKTYLALRTVLHA
jgi:hypothetical protein